MQQNEEYEGLKDILQVIYDMLGIGTNVIDFTKEAKKISNDNMKTTVSNIVAGRVPQSIFNFITHGGKVEQVAVGEEQAEMFRQRMQERHVAYQESIITREDGIRQHMFIYCGQTIAGIPTLDKLQVEKIRDLFELELSSNAKELDINTFQTIAKGRQIGVADQLTLAQVYLFRQNVKDTDLKFCVLQDGKDAYKIYANDKDKMTDVLVRMSYDIANDPDSKFEQAAANYAKKRDRFFDLCGSGEYVVCDKNDPNNFIHLDKRGYSLHFFKKEAELQPDGTTADVVRDVTRPRHYKMDREQLFWHVRQIANPIIVPAGEFTLLSDINKAGLAFASPDIMTDYVMFKELHKTDELAIDKYPKKKARYTEQMLDGYTHLPMSLVQQIKRDLPYVHTNDVDSIAFVKEQKPEVDEYLQSHVFHAIGDPLQALAFRWKIEGRCGSMNPQLSGEIKNRLAIINPDDTQMMIGIDEGGAYVYRNGKETDMCQTTSEDYPEFMQRYIGMIQNPVVLLAEELASSDVNRLISERANRYAENPAITEMVNIEEIEKAELVENIGNTDEIRLSPEQTKAVREIEKLHIHEKELSGKEAVKIRDRAVDKSLQKEREEGVER